MAGGGVEQVAGPGRRVPAPADIGVLERDQEGRGLVVEALPIERNDESRVTVGLTGLKEQLGPGRLDPGLEARVGQVHRRAPGGHPVPAGRDLVGARHGRESAGLGFAVEGQEDAQRRPVRDRVEQRRGRTGPGTTLGRVTQGVAGPSGRHRIGDLGVAPPRGSGGPARLLRQQRDRPVSGAQLVPAVGGDHHPQTGEVGPLPLEVQRADDEGQREGRPRVVLDLDRDVLLSALVAHGVRPLHGVAARHPQAGLDDRAVTDEVLADPRFAIGQVPAVVAADPPPEREPAAGVDQPGGSDAQAGPSLERADRRRSRNPVRGSAHAVAVTPRVS